MLSEGAGDLVFMRLGAAISPISPSTSQLTFQVCLPGRCFAPSISQLPTPNSQFPSPIPHPRARASGAPKEECGRGEPGQGELKI